MKRSLILRRIALLLLGASWVQANTDGVEVICGQEYVGDVTGPLMYNPNPWNHKSPDGGFSCMRVDNSTPAYDATWNWGANIQDVHAFPYVRFGSVDLPMRLSSIRSIHLSTDWIMTAGSISEFPRVFTKSIWSKNKSKLEKNNIQANAAWDFFLDNDRNKTLYPQVAAIEFMVWLGSVGDPWWLGRLNSTILSNITLGDAEFSLYYGRNSGGTHVFTAVPRDGEDILSIDQDFYPLLEFILKQAHKHPEIPDDLPRDPYLGIVEFGTETWYSDGNATFTAANFGMKLDGDVESNGSNSSDNNSTSENGGGSSDGDDDSAAVTLDVLPVFIYTTAVMLIVGALW
ncbi:concanavalin A-like lectin/glucanase domain-containing protein [Ilyonectria sp. MPI-CAGE-AT-0026]|nr:concanavalin A-like lectin/glucanase domain-containing protein [Ilyonectria sp. MPI-CAGE-AT-0026]